MPIEQAPENPYTAGFQKTPAQARHEARAKVFWGDSPVDVIKYLQMQSISYDEACIMVDEMYREREKVIRASGVRRIIVGITMVAVPIVTWIIFAMIGAASLTLMGIAAVIGLAGAWFCLKGTFMLLSPHTETGDVADQ